MSESSVSIEELARKLKMNKTTVYKLIHAGKIPAVKKGNKWEIDKEGITQWLGMKMGEFSMDDLTHIEKDDKEAVIEITPLIKEENVLFNLFPFLQDLYKFFIIFAMGKLIPCHSIPKNSTQSSHKFQMYIIPWGTDQKYKMCRITIYRFKV